MNQVESSILNELVNIAKLLNVDLIENRGRYSISSDELKIEVKFQPEWIGLELEIFFGKKNSLNFSIDTDNYKISDPSNTWFKNVISEDIVAVLIALSQGKLLIGTHKNKRSIIVPTSNQYVRVSQTKLFPLTSRFDTLDKAKSGGEYSSLNIAE